MAGWTDGKNDSMSVSKLYQVCSCLQSWNLKILKNFSSAENNSLHGTFITIMEPPNIQDKFVVAVKKKKKLVGHLVSHLRGKQDNSPKLFSTFSNPVTITAVM